LLAERGDPAWVAVTAAEATALLERLRPELILVDRHLPDDGGQQLIRNLRRQRPTARIILTARDEEPGLDQFARQHGAHTVLIQPFERQRLDEALRESQARPPRMRVSVSLKITLPYVLLALLLVVGAAYLTSQLVFESMEARFKNQLIEAGKVTADSMVQVENELLETLRLIVHTEGMPQAIRSGNAEQLRLWTLPVAVNAGEDAVDVLDTSGISVLSLHHRASGSAEDYVASRGETSYAGWDAVQRVLLANADQLGDKQAQMVEAPWGRYLYVAGPVYDEAGQLAGVVLVGRSLTKLTETIRRNTLAQTSLYARDGRVLASTFIEPIAPLPADQAQAISEAPASSHLIDLTVGSIDYTQIMGPWEVRTGSRSLGIVAAALPRAFWVRPSEVTRLQIFSLIAVTFLLIVLVGVFVANRITRPLLKVVEASSQVAQGNLEARVEPTGTDELAYLAYMFNYMVTELRASAHENARLYTELAASYDNTLDALTRALDLRDRETEGHSRRVVEYTARLAREIGLDEAEIAQIRRGALLHDIGKIGVPDAVLHKPGALTPQERRLIEEHPKAGFEMLLGIPYLQEEIKLVLTHQEKWDGTGYPLGLRGEAIPLGARLFAIADTFDAITSDRSYRKGRPYAVARKIIAAESGRQFDPRAVQAFLAVPADEWLAIRHAVMQEVQERQAEQDARLQGALEAMIHAPLVLERAPQTHLLTGPGAAGE
jgi:putative nucleotidyltransferase with HDIG domain